MTNTSSTAVAILSLLSSMAFSTPSVRVATLAETSPAAAVLPAATSVTALIVLDSADNAYVVLPFGRIVTASKASGWTDWTLRFDGSALGAFGEVVIDRSRVASDGVLSIMYQRSSSGTTPSPIRVVDFQID